MTRGLRSLLWLAGLGAWAALAGESAVPPAAVRPGFIQIKGEAGTRILLDGQECGVTTRELGGLIIQDVLPGTYVLQARKEGFRPQELRATVEPGAVQLVYLPLFQERAAAAGGPGTVEATIGQHTGALVIRSVPVDCRLRIPKLQVDSEKSTAEWRANAVPLGTCEIEAVALGQTLTQAVTIEAGKTADVMLNFLRGEVRVVASQAASVAVTALPPAPLPTAAQIQRTSAQLQTVERELGDVRGALQRAEPGPDLARVRQMLARRDELARRQRDLAYELNLLQQQQHNEEESARREAAVQRRKEFDTDHAEYARLAKDPDVPPELARHAWRALCTRWSIDPSGGPARLLWDEAKAAPCKVTSRIVQLGEGTDLELVEIIAGSFAMGSEDGDDDEQPVHNVSITRPFWIGKYEVTQAQYRVIMGTAPAHFQGDERPVESVTWQDAQAFCKRLTEREQKAGRLPPGHDFRLPTEAEWEYACRAGAASSFSFGDLLDATLANYDVSQGAGRSGPTPARETLPVGSFRGNAWDLYDMHGNVWEWCQDWYDREFYARSPGTNPVNMRPSSAIVSRGGSWVNPASFCRSANRNNGETRQANRMTGFRVVLGQPPIL